VNSKAQAIGMTHTKVQDIYGAEGALLTNTEDIFQLAKYLYNYRKFILDLSMNNVTSGSYGPSSFDHLESQSIFKDDPEYLGGMKVKTGETTESAFALFNVEYGDAKAPIVIIVLNSETAEDTIHSIREYIRTHYIQTIPTPTI
jgi:D-alanyl-D-alanine carboxypeptidase